MPKQKHVSVPPDLLEAFRTMVQAVPGVDVKGDANPYVAMNGNMYASISKAGEIGVRLPKAEREAFLKKTTAPSTNPFRGFSRRNT